MKIKTLYEYSKTNNKKLLFEKVSGITYPTIEGNTSNFLTDYASMAPELDRMFYIKYASMKPIIPEDDETTAQYFDEWADCIRAVLSYYLDAWARLYYALSLQYNPIYNVDGETTRRTQGKTEGLSGTDTTTMQRGARSETDQFGQKQLTDLYGQDQTTNLYGEDQTNNVYGAKGSGDTHSEVPFDSGIEKEICHDAHSEDTYTDSVTNLTHTDTVTRAQKTDTHTDSQHTDTHSALSYTDSDATLYGKQNNVDYTETEVRKGNIGVTMTQTMLMEEYRVRKMAFWDNVFKAICKELLYW